MLFGVDGPHCVLKKLDDVLLKWYQHFTVPLAVLMEMRGSEEWPGQRKGEGRQGESGGTGGDIGIQEDGWRGDRETWIQGETGRRGGREKGRQGAGEGDIGIRGGGTGGEVTGRRARGRGHT
jgi:hypothetical protein